MRLILMLKDVYDKDDAVWLKGNLYPIVKLTGQMVLCKTEQPGRDFALDTMDIGKTFEVEWCTGQRGKLRECLRCAGCDIKGEKNEI